MVKNTAIAFVALMMSFSAYAAQQTYQVTATVSNVYESTPGSLPAPLNPGDEVVMTYVMEESKAPDYQDAWGISYMFNPNEGSLELGWSNVTIKASPSQANTDHYIGLDPNNNNGVQFYHVGSPGPFEVNGNAAPGIHYMAMDLQNNGMQYQSYTPWLTPELNLYSPKMLHVSADGFTIDADVNSVVKVGGTQPVSVPPKTYKVTAIIDSVYENYAGALPAPLHVGDEVVMTYVLNETKAPVFQDNLNIDYEFAQYEANIELSWSNVTFKTSSSQSLIRHQIRLDANNGGVQHYHIGGDAFDLNGSPAPNVTIVGLDFHSDGPLFQSYEPWLVPDLNRFSAKTVVLFANEYGFQANVTSIVKGTEPFTVWPEQGTMHVSQHFDVFVKAPGGFDFIELYSDTMAPPLPVACDIAPNYNGLPETKILCRDLTADKLQIMNPNYTGVTIRVKNPMTGQSLERKIDWKMVD
ncbi:MAG: hypothetical protein ACU84J_01110 [Gammaproteobacteria bacterium]